MPTVEWLMNKKDKQISFDFPIPRTHCGVLLGNGNFGMQAWGVNRLCLTVNRADYWDHRDGQEVPEKGSYQKIVEKYGTPNESDDFIQILNYHQYPPPRKKSTRLPFGRFEMIFAEGVILQKAILNMGKGTLVIELKNASGALCFLTLAMSIKENIAAVLDKEGLIKDVKIRPAQEWVADSFAEKNIAPPELICEGRITGWAQELPEDPSMAGVCRRIPGGYLISLERGNDNQAAKSACVGAMRRCKSRGLEVFFEANAEWWREFWRSVPQVKFPEKFFNQFFVYALYKFACATMPESPIPSGLQGPWGEEYQMIPWNGDYHFNVNIQQIYTLAFAISRTEHLRPLFNMLGSEKFSSVMRRTARRLYGVDDGLVITHAVDDLGRQVGGLGVGAVIDQACGGWTALLYWLYYQYTGDVDFLREQAYPFLHGMMRSYEGMLRKHNGSYRMPVGISAEYRCQNENGNTVNYGPNPSYQLACIHMLLNALFETCDILNIEPLESWRDIKKNLPLYSLEEGEDGPMIAVWEGQNLDVCHRHHSHLGCVYPFDSLGKMSVEKQKILDNSIDHWILKGMGQWSEWCIPWAAIIQARLGFNNAPVVLLNMWKEIFVNEGMNTVYLPRFRGMIAHRRHDMNKPKETTEVMQLDGTMGGATAMLEMLAHTHSGVAKIFAGIPDKWKDVSFANIRLPGPFLISASKKDGKFRKAQIKSLGGEIITIDVFGVSSAKLYRDGRSEDINLPCSLNMAKGEKITLMESGDLRGIK